MYLAAFNIGGAAWRQVAADLVYPSAGEEQGDRWWTRFRTLLRGLEAVPQLSTSLRIQLGVRLQAGLLAVAPEPQIGALRRVFGSLTQLGLLGDGEVGYARERSEHDLLLTFPRFRCCVTLPHLARGEAWFAFDFRVNPHLNELLSEAHTLEHTLGYHINIEPLQTDPEWLREAARNALRVSRSTGVPLALDELERNLAVKLRHATHISEEFLGVDSPAACEWLRGALTRRFADAYGRYVTPEFTFEEGGYEASLTATRHRIVFDPLGVDEICSCAITTEERTELLAWEPASELLELMPRVSAVEEILASKSLDYSGMPRPYDGKEPYAFISYKREDLERIKMLVAEFGRRGYRIWYDKGIPGGSEWDALIEERLQSCEVLVLFLSQRAVKSKYVRREVKFADTLNKPIVGVKLERDLDLSDGLALLFNQYQVIDGNAASPGDELDRAIRFVRLQPS